MCVCLCVSVAVLFPGALSRYDKTSPIQVWFNNIHTYMHIQIYIYVFVCVYVPQLYFWELYRVMIKLNQFKLHFNPHLTIYTHTYKYTCLYLCVCVCVAALFLGALSRHDKTRAIQIGFKSAFNNIHTYIQIYIFVFVCAAALFPGALSRHDKTSAIQIGFKSALPLSRARTWLPYW